MCGIVGMFDGSKSKDRVAAELYMALCLLQHRGKEGAGIAVSDGQTPRCIKDVGTVPHVFGDDLFTKWDGESGIGHVRYSTSGAGGPDNVQPIPGLFREKPFFLAHNGNLVRHRELRESLKTRGYDFKTTTDTEIVAALIHYSAQETFEEAFIDALLQIEGAYAFVALYEGRVLGVRDPFGNRTLVIGEGREMIMLASESAIMDVLHVKPLRDVQPGEMIVIDPAKNKWYSIYRLPKRERKLCVFEAVYFHRPDSMFDGQRVQSSREAMGHYLWQEHPVAADIVVPIPNSGRFAAVGVARESRLPLEEAFCRSDNLGRTFIEPVGRARARSLSLKLNIIPELVVGKRVVVVDDSIVRANVMKGVVQHLRRAGAREIHLRISSPMYTFPCFYGIDTYRVKDELVAARAQGDVEYIRREIGADSLAYLSLEKLLAAAGGNGGSGFCHACFSGEYHIPIEKQLVTIGERS